MPIPSTCCENVSKKKGFLDMSASSWSSTKPYNIYGRKKWVFAHPKYSRLMRTVPSIDGMFAVSPLDAFDEAEDNPVLRIPRYENVLEPGDMLFVAGWWWHAVKNVSDYSIGVANRVGMPVGISRNNWLYSSVFFSHPRMIYKRFVKPRLDSSDDAELSVLSNKAFEEDHVNNITSNFK